MKSTLWKLTALAGVMGAGFLVVYQAQKNLAQQPMAGESRDGGENFAPPESSDSTDPSGTETGIDSLSEDESHASRLGAPVTEGAPPSQGDEPGLPVQSEPTPTVEAATAADTFNPFANEPASSATASSGPSDPNDGAESSRFADLVASFTDAAGAADPPTESGPRGENSPGSFTASDQRLFEDAAAPLPNQPSDEPANPFARADTKTEGQGGRFANERFESEPTLAGLQAAESQTSPATTTDDDPFAADAIRTPLSGPASGGDRSAVAAASFDVADGPERVPSQETDPQEAPGLANLGADEPILPPAADPFGVVPVSNEEPAAESGEPNPFLVLPGGPPESTTQPATASAATQPGDSQPEWRAQPTAATPDPPNELHTDAAPLFPQTPPQTEQQPRNLGAPDDGVEVTIHPRSRSATNLFPDIAAARPADNPTVATADPFGTSSPSSQTPSSSAPPSTEPPSGPRSASPFPGPSPDAQSLSEATVRPLPAVRPAPDLLLPAAPSDPRSRPASNEGPLVGRRQPEPRVIDPAPGPQEFLGVGTVEADSPVGTQQAQLAIEKQAPADAVVGQPLIYSIRVRNIGRAVAENIVVRDVTPKGSRLVGTIPQAELDEPNNKLIWRLGKLASGESKTIKVKVTPTQAGSIGSVATVSFEAAVASRTVITAPELKLTIQGPDEVGVGEKAAYRFTLTNAGSADASGVYIRNLIPEGFEHPRGDDLEYDIGVLRRGQSKDIDLTLLAVSPGDYQNRAILGADGDVSVEAAKTVSVLESRLTVRREGPANRFVGREARYTNTITNESRSALQEVTVVENVPAGVRFEEASDGGVYDPQRQTVTWRFRQLEPGSQQQVHIAVIPLQANEHVTTVKAFDARGSLAEVESRLAVAGFSSLKIDVAHDGAPVPVGEEVALRLTIKNRGTAAANQVKTLVEVPPEMRFVEAKGPVRYQLVSNNLIEFEAINSLEIGGEQQFDIVLAAARKGDARVRVELQSAELTRPLNQEELVVIHPNQQ